MMAPIDGPDFILLEDEFSPWVDDRGEPILEIDDVDGTWVPPHPVFGGHSIFMGRPHRYSILFFFPASNRVGSCWALS